AVPASAPLPKRPDAGPTIEEGANLERRDDKDLEILIPMREADQAAPLLMRWPHGMGQVSLAAFDLDEPPFTTWPSQADFWLRTFLPKYGFKIPPKQADPGAGPRYYDLYRATAAFDLASQLQGRLDKFQDVSVISFGWVALFILIYIVIVGPLDYLFLK